MVGFAGFEGGASWRQFAPGWVLALANVALAAAGCALSLVACGESYAAVKLGGTLLHNMLEAGYQGNSPTSTPTAVPTNLPVWANGRVQPFDSVARTGLQQISGPVKGPMSNPTAWLLEVLARPDAADTRRIFPISNGELLGKLQLQPLERDSKE